MRGKKGDITPKGETILSTCEPEAESLVDKQFGPHQGRKEPLVHRRKEATKIAQTSSSRDSLESHVRFGKIVHVRVTLGYLTGVYNPRPKKKMPPYVGLITVFAEIEPGIHDSAYSHASSRPLSFVGDMATAVWPEVHHDAGGEPYSASCKTQRRLYFAALLRKTDGLEPTQETYSSETIRIRLGLMRNGKKIHLGVANLIVKGDEIHGKRFALRVQQNQAPQRRGLFGRKSAKSMNSFSDDGQVYSLKNDSFLSLRLDVRSSMYSLGGPSLWGDIDGDDDSFSPIIEGDIDFLLSNSGQNTVTSDDEYEAIEVLKDCSGTTIFTFLEKSPRGQGSGPVWGPPENLVVNGRTRFDNRADERPKNVPDQETTRKLAEEMPSPGSPLQYKKSSSAISHWTNSTNAPSTDASLRENVSAQGKLPVRNKSGVELDMLLNAVGDRSVGSCLAQPG